MANRSTFPTTIDSFLEHYDISSTDVANVLRFQELKLKTSLISGEQTELTNLTTTLRDKIFTPEDFNKLQDCITSMETFIRDNVEDYITTKQTEFNTTLQKFSDKDVFNSTVTYMQWNTVQYSGQTFMSKQDNNLTHIPIGGTEDLWWQLIAQKGANGEQGEQGLPGIGLSFRGVYDSETIYNINDACEHAGSLYWCKQDGVFGFTPTNTTYWEIVIQKGGSVVVSTLRYTTTLALEASNVPFVGSGKISAFNKNLDSLFVFVNSIYYESGHDYILDANNLSIDKINGTFPAGTVIYFIVIKNIVEIITFNDGTLIQDETIHITKLASDAKPTISLVAPSSPINGQRWVDLND